jgi:hypothetical protein
MEKLIFKKEGSFKKVNFSVFKTGGYGQYVIIARYKGKDLKIHHDCSLNYDNCDSENAGERAEARKSIYCAIKNHYDGSR